MSKKSGEQAGSEEIWNKVERELIVGRHQEINGFKELLLGTNLEKRLVAVYGTGGIGKSFLLDAFRYIAELHDVCMITVDSRDIVHQPLDFCKQAVHLLEARLNAYSAIEPETVTVCIRRLNELASKQRWCLAVDTYEEMAELDHWIREHLIKQLDRSILVILSGRNALQGAWKMSPYWRRSMVSIPLQDLSYSDVRDYLHQLAITDENIIHWIWTKTKGHPLTLSLSAQTSSLHELVHLQETEILPFITKQWLKEVPNPELRKLVEIAAVLKHFNQESLAYVLDQQVTTEDFYQLTSLSFVRKVKRGWLLHDLVRAAFSQELHSRAPVYYTSSKRRCIKYYYDQMTRTAGVAGDISLEASDFFHYLGDELIRQFFNQDAVTNSLETLDESNLAEAERYIERRKQTATETRIPFIDPKTNQTSEFIITPEQNLFNLKHIHLRELLQLAPNIVKLLRKPSGEVVGMIAVIPIQESTLHYLLNKPLSSAYFSSLSQEQLDEFAAPADTPPGYYIQTMDVLNYSDTTLLADTGHFFITLLLTGGFVAGSPPPIPFATEIHHRLGCEMSEAVHYDYDGVTPTHTFTTDTRGGKLKSYLQKMISRLGMGEIVGGELAAEPLNPPLTDIQRSIVELVVQGMTNGQIAQKLFLSEITVKKHLTSIFHKLNVRNRAQLVNKIVSADGRGAT